MERFTFDLRWKYAAGGLAYDEPGFVHRCWSICERGCDGSARPNRIFETALSVAQSAGLVGRKGAGLDSSL